MGLLLMVVVILLMPSVLFFYMQWKCAGKMLCFFLEEDKSTRPELTRIEGDFIVSEEGMYDIEPEKIRLMRYPLGWPRFLQQILPAGLYERDNAIPLDWITLEAATISASELHTVLDKNWLKNLVAGAREGATGGKFEKMVPMLSLAVSGLVLLMMFILMTKIG